MSNHLTVNDVEPTLETPESSGGDPQCLVKTIFFHAEILVESCYINPTVAYHFVGLNHDQNHHVV